MVTLEQPRLFKLSEHAIDGRQTNVHVISLCKYCQVPAGFCFAGPMKELKNLDAGNGCLQPAAFQVIGVGVLGFGHDSRSQGLANHGFAVPA